MHDEGTHSAAILVLTQRAMGSPSMHLSTAQSRFRTPLFPLLAAMSSPAPASATSHLNDTHKAQVLAYLRFFQTKREQNAKELEAVFDEQKDMRSATRCMLLSEAKRAGRGDELRIVLMSLPCCFAVSVCVRLLEEVYPVDEVGQILDGVKSTVKSQLMEDMEKLAQQSVLYLRQVFLQAEGNGVAINVNLSDLDDK